VVAGHSLVVDMQSWQILLDDIKSACRQLSNHQPIQLPVKTTSYRQWAERLVEYARSPEMEHELDFWLAESRRRVKPLPRDFPEGINTGASTRRFASMLSVEETQALQQAVARLEGTQVDGVLLTALARAFMSWTGQQILLVTVEGHGREPIFDDIDLSRTVGTFAMDFPLLIDLQGIDDPGEALHVVNEQLHQPANRGISYNVLRYMSTDQAVKQRLADMPESEIFFNYLASSLVPEVSEYRVAGPYNGRVYTMDLVERQTSTFLITGFIVNDQLQVTWHCSENLYRRETIARLAERTFEELRALITALHPS
jgi:non-ribosomal peptide synthase protein (TIGR01720 family)